MAKIGFYQFSPEFGNIQKNLATVLAALHEADADIIVLPELSFTGYFFHNREELRQLAEDPQESGTVEQLLSLCRKQDVYLVTGFAEKSGEQYFNSSLLLGPEGLVATYRKLHLFNTEKLCFDAGDLPLQVYEIRGIKIGMMVCFDWAFPEVARVLTLQGADVICHPSNLVLTYCQQTMLVRCIENAVFAITANRYGTEKRPQGELAFTGQSQIAAPKGALLYRSTADQDDLCILDVDIQLAREKRITEHNDIIADRRPEFYTALLEQEC